MTVKTQISEADITRIAPDQRLFFTIFSEPDHRYYARRRAIEQAPDPRVSIKRMTPAIPTALAMPPSTITRCLMSPIPTIGCASI